MNLKYQLIGIIGSAIISFTSQTSAESRALSPFNGFYAGLSIGHSTMSAKKKSGSSFPGPQSFSGGNNFSSSNMIGTLSLGYGIPLTDQYNVIFEPYVFWDSQRAKSSANYSMPPFINTQINEVFQRKTGAGFKTSLGYLINQQTLLHGGIVIENSSFSSNFNLLPIVPGYVSSATKKKNLWGVGPIVGIKLALTPKSSVEVNYTYTIYEQYKVSFPLSPTSTFGSKVTPHFSIFRVGYSYKF